MAASVLAPAHPAQRRLSDAVREAYRKHGHRGLEPSVGADHVSAFGAASSDRPLGDGCALFRRDPVGCDVLHHLQCAPDLLSVALLLLRRQLAQLLISLCSSLAPDCGLDRTWLDEYDVDAVRREFDAHRFGPHPDGEL